VQPRDIAGSEKGTYYSFTSWLDHDPIAVNRGRNRNSLAMRELGEVAGVVAS
jgi:hypothetical protein